MNKELTGDNQTAQGIVLEIKMKRRPYIIGIVAGLALTFAAGFPGYSRIVSSAESFRHHFSAMQTTSGPLGPVERFVFSLVMANSQPAPRNK
jgi:hypothetical protein